MKKKSILNLSLHLILSIVILSEISCESPNKNNDRPNIVYILADDLGYGELGSFGQTEIETPNIDLLASEGMIFTDHYSGSPVCAPSRSVLMTGLHTGKTPIRDNDEWSARGNIGSLKAMFEDSKLEGQRPLPDSIVTVAQLLQKNGYKTGIFGKWGLGAPNTNSIPNKKGFDYFYGYNCQRIAHTFYPSHLWRNGERDILDNYIIERAVGLSPDLDKYDPVNYKPFNQKDYAPTLIQNELIKFIEDNKEDNFFVYYANQIPHLALQAPSKWENYYREKFGQEEPFTGKSYYPSLTPKATYAAMISYLDEQVGEIVKKLKQIGKYENTLIIFTSDNGPTHKKEVDTNFFKSAGNLNGERNRLKGSVHEAGIRVPFIASWPKSIEKGSKSNHISAFQDFFPTVCDILEIDAPYPIDGISYLPTFLGRDQKKHEYLYWEISGYGGQQAIRQGNWKGLKKNLQKGKQKLELYNLEKDILEKNDVSKDNADIVEKLEKLLVEARTKPTLNRFKIKALDN